MDDAILEKARRALVMARAAARDLEAVVAMLEGDAPRPSPVDLTAKAELRSQAVAVLDFLNAKAGRQFQAVDANLSLIQARLKEGYDVATLRAIVARQSRKWKDDERMASYLRPKTLFNATNCAQYRGEVEIDPPKETP